MKQIFCGILIIISTAAGQVNTEEIRHNSSTPVSGLLRITFNMNGGNSDILVLGMNSNLQIKSNRHLYIIAADVDYITEEFGKSFGHLRYNFEIHPQRSYFEGFSQYQYDKSTRLEHRVLFGSGIRYHIVSRVFTGVGLMQEHEKLISAENPTTVYRLTSYLTLSKTIGESVSLTGISYYQPAIQEMSDYRFLVEASAGFSLFDQFKFELNISCRYDNQPQNDLKPFDYHIKNGLTYYF